MRIRYRERPSCATVTDFASSTPVVTVNCRRAMGNCLCSFCRFFARPPGLQCTAASRVSCSDWQAKTAETQKKRHRTHATSRGRRSCIRTITRSMNPRFRAPWSSTGDHMQRGGAPHSFGPRSGRVALARFLRAADTIKESVRFFGTTFGEGLTLGTPVCQPHIQVL